MRRRILTGLPIDVAEMQHAILTEIHAAFQADQRRTMQHVINATGVLLHTNLGRAPLADKAVERMRQAVAYTNLELELESGKRSRRGARVCELLAELAGAEDAVVVNNCAAATMLVLNCIASAKEVIVSRGQLVEIGGGFRLPEVFESANVRLREVGTTNRTYVRDYEAAISEMTGAILRVHRSNFFQTGFVAEPTIEELASIRRPKSLPVIDDLGSGCVVDLAPLGLCEPTVQNSVQKGADLCLFSGDKLFGGPQCGIVVGKKIWMEQLRGTPFMRALRADKLTLAALEATTEIHLAGRSVQQLPVYQMLARRPEDIRAQCARVINELTRIAERDHFQPPAMRILECQSEIGGGSMPGVHLSSFGICVECESPENLAADLRSGAPAILCRLTQDRLLLDLRTVLPHEVDDLLLGLSGNISSRFSRQETPLAPQVPPSNPDSTTEIS